MAKKMPAPEKTAEGSARRIEDLYKILENMDSPTAASEPLLDRFMSRYTRLSPEERLSLFDAILRRMEIQKKDIDSELETVLHADADDPIAWSRSLTALRRKVASPRVDVFRRFLNIPGGLKFLLDFRADLLSAQRHASTDLELVDADIANLFNTWFQQGFLFLREITLDSSYRHIQFLTKHDMVHPMTSIEEMASRLGRDRRCFALFHHAMPEEIVIFIEVALTRGVAGSIHDIIRQDTENTGPVRNPNTAIFYSINNSQNGLASLGLGKVLIFQVVDAIKRDHPGIKTFATLSPVPGLWKRYLARILAGDDEPFALKKQDIEDLFSDKRRRSLFEYYSRKTMQKPEPEPAGPDKAGTGTREASGSPEDLASVLMSILSDPTWIEDRTYRELLEKPLTEITYAHVGKEEKKPGKPLNPVANFHMGNGATISRRNVNFAANRSERGVKDSCGMMVNYVYSESRPQQVNRTMKSLLRWHK